MDALHELEQSNPEAAQAFVELLRMAIAEDQDAIGLLRSDVWETDPKAARALIETMTGAMNR